MCSPLSFPGLLTRCFGIAAAVRLRSIRNHREALKSRLAVGTLTIEELEYAVRLMIMSGRFAGTQGMLPETMLMPHLPDKYLAPPSPFRTIADLASSLPWLLRVHQSMQWVQQMPNGLMTVQRLICPAASEMGGLAAPDGVLSVDWPKVEEIMNRPSEAPAPADGYRPSMAGDPRFPRGAQPFRPDGTMVEGGMVGPGGAMMAGTMGPMGTGLGTPTEVAVGGMMVGADGSPLPEQPAISPQTEKSARRKNNSGRNNKGGKGGSKDGSKTKDSSKDGGKDKEKDGGKEKDSGKDKDKDGGKDKEGSKDKEGAKDKEGVKDKESGKDKEGGKDREGGKDKDTGKEGSKESGGGKDGGDAKHDSKSGDGAKAAASSPPGTDAAPKELKSDAKTAAGALPATPAA